MSKLIITGIAGIVALGGLAVLPQISTAAATSTYATPADASYETKPAAQPTVSVGFGQGSYYAPAFAANGQAAYRTCFMKRTVTFTAQGPKQVTTPTCAD
jgi:hypothetical protein